MIHCYYFCCFVFVDIQVVAEEKATSITLGGDPEASIGRTGWNKNLNRFCLVFGHNVTWCGKSMKDLKNSRSILTCLRLKTKKFGNNGSIIPKTNQFYGACVNDIVWLKEKPELLVKYNFEQYHNLDSINKSEECQNSIKKFAIDSWLEEEKKNEELRAKIEV